MGGGRGKLGKREVGWGGKLEKRGGEWGGKLGKREVGWGRKAKEGGGEVGRKLGKREVGGGGKLGKREGEREGNWELWKAGTLVGIYCMRKDYFQFKRKKKSVLHGAIEGQGALEGLQPPWKYSCPNIFAPSLLCLFLMNSPSNCHLFIMFLLPSRAQAP